MSEWKSIGHQWYQHTSGAVVQKWGSKWFAWRADSPNDDFGYWFRTLRAAQEWCLSTKQED